MLRKILIFFLAFVSFIYVNAQDSSSKGALTITGSLDAYYRYNFQNARDSGHTNNYTSFTNSQNSFELGMASIKAEYAIGKVDGVIDLGFGRRAQEFSYNDGGSTAAIKQAYVSFAPSDKVKFTMGKWTTHVGYELLDAYLNRNYSMDYMFSYGPFFHTGLKMDVTANQNFGFMVGVSNPNDMTTASFSKKFFLGQVHFTSTNAKVNAYLNYVGGKDSYETMSNQVDAVVTGTISSKFSIGYNGTVKFAKPDGKSSSDSWWGSAVYLNFDPTSVFGLTARAEYFDDEDGVAGFYNKIFDFTLSGNVHLGNLTIIPEFRVDSGEEPLFYKTEDATGAPSAKSTGTFILAATYHF
jgi:hypothetical protein